VWKQCTALGLGRGARAMLRLPVVGPMSPNPVFERAPRAARETGI